MFNFLGLRVILVTFFCIFLVTNFGRGDIVGGVNLKGGVLVIVEGRFYDSKFIDRLVEQLYWAGFSKVGVQWGDSCGIGKSRGWDLSWGEVGFNFDFLYTIVDSCIGSSGWNLVIYYISDFAFLWKRSFYSIDGVVGLSIGRYIFISGYRQDYLPKIFNHEFGHYLGMEHCLRGGCYMGWIINNDMGGFCFEHKGVYDDFVFFGGTHFKNTDIEMKYMNTGIGKLGDSLYIY